VDNSDVKRNVILTRKSYNSLTGETTVITKPKPKPKKKKVVVASGKGSEYTVGDVLISRVKPLHFAMMRQLFQKGINATSMNFKTVVIYYYNNFCINTTNRKPYDVSAFINLPAFKIRLDRETSADPNDARNKSSFVDVVEVADAIISIFRQAKARYDTLITEGFDPKEMMNDEQYSQAKAAIIVENDLLKKFRSDNFMKVGEFSTSITWILAFVVVIYFINSLDA